MRKYLALVKVTSGMEFERRRLVLVGVYPTRETACKEAERWVNASDHPHRCFIDVYEVEVSGAAVSACGS